MPVREPLIDMDTLERVAPIIRNLAHPLRLRIIDFLRHEGEPQSVGEIVRAAKGSQAVVSQHLRVLRDQGILSARREGSFILYAISDKTVLLILDCIRMHAAERK